MRCGSYPFMNIAEDHGVDYGTVLSYADAVEHTRKNIPLTYWEMTAIVKMMHRAPAHMAVDKYYSEKWK